MDITKSCVAYYTEEGFIVAVTGGWIDEELAATYASINVQTANSETHYVEDGVLKDKVDWTPLVQDNSITNIPESSRVYVNGEKLTITDGILELEKPSFYKVTVVIESVTHKPKEVLV